jgi:hypothetical protein
MRPAVTAKNPIDRRPFKSKADQQMQMALEKQYRGVAIPQVVAVLESRKAAAATQQARG